MRKFAAAAAGVSLFAIALTGCTTTPDNSAMCERADTIRAADLGTFTGDVGSKPDVSLFTPVATKSTKTVDLVTGDGGALETDRQIAVIDFALYDGESGIELFATEFDGDLTRVTNLLTLSNTFPMAADMLNCATVGSRVVAAIPSAELGEQAVAGLGLAEDSSVVAVFDVVEAESPGAQGTLHYNDAVGMPSVVRAPDGRPGVIVPDATEPVSARIETLIDGDGAPVAEEDGAVWVEVLQVAWDDRTVVSNTWDANPMAVDTLPSSVQDAVRSATIGSQLLIVTPSDGEQARTMIYVVDVLGVTPARQQ